MNTQGGLTKFAAPGDAVPERTTVRITGIIHDESGAVLPSFMLTSLTLTLWDLTGGSEAIVNAVDGLSILNTGRGTVDAVGQLILTLSPADLSILNASHAYEQRRALIGWTYGGAAKAGRHEVEWYVRNLAKVP